VNKKYLNIIQLISNVLIIGGLLSNSCHAECIRFNTEQYLIDTKPDIYGAESFSELHNTLSLECLKYVGSIRKNDYEYVLIKDDRGKIHSLTEGSYMGENNGVIKKIDSDFIYIKQLINQNGNWQEVPVKFSKHKKN